MPLSARRARRRPVRTVAVGISRRLLSSIIDALLPSLGLFLMVYFDALKLEYLHPRPGIFSVDRFFLLLYRSPHLLTYLPLTWMLWWTAFNLAWLGTIRTTPGKWLTRLKVRQRNGEIAGRGRMILRVLFAWTVPLTLGLSYIWIVISPERRGWHDVLSMTYVVRDER